MEVGFNSPSSQSRIWLCFQSMGLTIVLHVQLLLSLLSALILEKGISKSQEPSYLFCIPLAVCPPLLTTNSQSQPQSRCSDVILERSSSSIHTLVSSGEQSYLSSDKPLELYLWSAGSASSALAFAGRQGKENSYLPIQSGHWAKFITFHMR